MLDPACGSGSFLLGAFQFLLDWYRDRYIEDSPKKHAAGKQPRLYQHGSSPGTSRSGSHKTSGGGGGSGGEWRLTTTERKRIVLSHIHGVDIDPQAVETTKLSLLLKVLEGENAETIGANLRLFHERALPDLAANIKCGNSLIGPDFYDNQQMAMFDEEERLRINVFDWQVEFKDIMKDGGFDAVIGNPPYDVLEKERRNASWPHSALSDYVRRTPEYFDALGGKTNLFRFFIVRSIKIAKCDGHFGMIVPLALLADVSCASTRLKFIKSTRDLRTDCFPQKDRPNRRVFLNAKLSTVVLTAAFTTHNAEADPTVEVYTYPWNSFNDASRHCKVLLSECALIDPDNLPIPLLDELTWNVCKRVHTANMVSHLGARNTFRVTRGEINQTIYRTFIKRDSSLARLVKGVEIGRFVIRAQLSQGAHEWFDEAAYLAVKNPKPIVCSRRIATQRITGVDERLRIVATIIDPPAYFADSTNSITLQGESPYQLEYILGICNSRLYQWRFKLTSTNNNVGTNELAAMPIRMIKFTDQLDRAHHDRMVSLVQMMIDLHKQLGAAKTGHTKTAIQRQIDATDRQIDRLVYELYGLTDEEIRIVEEATQ